MLKHLISFWFSFSRCWFFSVIIAMLMLMIYFRCRCFDISWFRLSLRRWCFDTPLMISSSCRRHDTDTLSMLYFIFLIIFADAVFSAPCCLLLTFVAAIMITFATLRFRCQLRNIHWLRFAFDDYFDTRCYLCAFLFFSLIDYVFSLPPLMPFVYCCWLCRWLTNIYHTYNIQGSWAMAHAYFRHDFIRQDYFHTPFRFFFHWYAWIASCRCWCAIIFRAAVELRHFRCRYYCWRFHWFRRHDYDISAFRGATYAFYAPPLFRLRRWYAPLIYIHD